MTKLSIYIHVPWCERRCPYCNFYFVVGRPSGNFIEALIKEYEYRRQQYQVVPAISLYFGGGTPSLLAPEKIHQLIDYFLSCGALDEHAEITLEANPEHLSREFARRLVGTKINRISLGVQSFNDQALKRLGRKHRKASAEMAIDNLLASGFTNLSVDLIVGAPEEELIDIANSLEYLARLGVPHISAYLLTIEEGTKFYQRIRAGQMADPSEEYQALVYAQVQNKLSELDYLQYDISSYAKDGYMSLHNRLYWAAQNYIGLGPGSHSMKIFDNGGTLRVQNHSALKDWLNDPTNDKNWDSEFLSPQQALRESLAFGLRNMAEGINPHLLSAHHKTPLPASFEMICQKFKDFGWLVAEQGSLKISKEGALFADAVMRDILCC